MSDGELRKFEADASLNIDIFNPSDEFLIDLVYNDLSFDSEQITKDDVINVFNSRLENVNPSIRQLIENQRNAFYFILEMVKNKTLFDENHLKDLHQIIMSGFSEIGGLYRNVDISVKGSNHTPPSHIKVYDRMKKYFTYLETNTFDTFEYIAYSHLQLAKIHPFLDGNGRCARLVLNYQLLKHNLFPVIITKEDKPIYFQSLEEFKVNKNIKPFIEFLKKLEHKAIDIAKK